MFVLKQISDRAHFSHTDWAWFCLRAGLKVKNVRYKWAGVDSRVGLYLVSPDCFPFPL